MDLFGDFEGTGGEQQNKQKKACKIKENGSVFHGRTP
jgi:hypothetical protein